jgi:hypothetical protein
MKTVSFMVFFFVAAFFCGCGNETDASRLLTFENGIRPQSADSLASITVQMSPTSTTLATNGIFVFSATETALVNGETVTSKEYATFNWSVVEADGGSITPLPKSTVYAQYTAPSVLGTYHVIATSKKNPEKSATLTVRVN